MVNPRSVPAENVADFFSEDFSRLKNYFVPDRLLNAHLNVTA